MPAMGLYQQASCAFVAALLLHPVATIAGPATPSSKCKPIPGDAKWPKAPEWTKLNRTVSGRLIPGVPLAAVCHQGGPFDGLYDADKCAAARAGWDRAPGHFPYPAEFNMPYFQNGTCDPFTPVEQPCLLGNYPSYIINVTGAADVKAGIDFAKKNNVRLVIKNTGHDFLGKSTGKGSLSLWTHNLKSIDIIRNYSSQGYRGPAIKLGAGVQGGEAYAAASAAGYAVLGGTCPTVGIAGGYTQGGGHSVLSSLHGLSADNVLEWEVVTASGEHVTATPYNRHSDLYWALSGGGGGTFGVVLSMTTRLFPDTTIGGASFMFTSAGVSDDTFWDAVGAFHALTPAFTDAGNSLTYVMAEGVFLAYSVTVPGATNTSTVEAAMQPFLDALSLRGVGYVFAPRIQPNFYAHFDKDFGPLPYGNWAVSEITTSRLVPRGVVLNETQNADVTAALRLTIGAGDKFNLACNTFNPGASGKTSRDNAVNPAWRDAVVHCIVVGIWDWTKPREVMLARQRELTEVIGPALDAASPGGGIYLNEANFEQADWKEQFYGANYPRLRQVKRRYDSAGVFYAVTAVGSEDFVVDGEGRLCRA